MKKIFLILTIVSLSSIVKAQYNDSIRFLDIPKPLEPMYEIEYTGFKDASISNKLEYYINFDKYNSCQIIKMERLGILLRNKNQHFNRPSKLYVRGFNKVMKRKIEDSLGNNFFEKIRQDTSSFSITDEYKSFQSCFKYEMNSDTLEIKLNEKKLKNTKWSYLDGLILKVENSLKEYSTKELISGVQIKIEKSPVKLKLAINFKNYTNPNCCNSGIDKDHTFFINIG